MLSIILYKHFYYDYIYIVLFDILNLFCVHIQHKIQSNQKHLLICARLVISIYFEPTPLTILACAMLDECEKRLIIFQ